MTNCAFLSPAHPMPLTAMLFNCHAPPIAAVRLYLEADAGLVAALETMPADTSELARAIGEHSPDVVFVGMGDDADTSAAAVIDAIPAAGRPVFVLVSADRADAVRAFQIGAIDCLIAPFDATRVRALVARIAQRAPAPPPETSILHAAHRMRAETSQLRSLLARRYGSRHWMERVAVRRDERVAFVQTSQIEYFAETHVGVEAVIGAHRYGTRTTISELAAGLDPVRFARVGERMLVNLDLVREVQPWFRGDYVLLLASGEKITVGADFREIVESPSRVVGA